MKHLLTKLFSPDMRWKTIIVCLVIITCTILVEEQVDRWIIKSRTVTQAQIEAGWKTAGIEIAPHTIEKKENYWKVAKHYSVDIDTIIGANPDLEELHAATGQKIRVPNRKGTIHRTEEQDNVQTISALYSVPVSSITAVNNLRSRHILVPGLELFIPNAKPVRLTVEMTEHYSLRGIFGSPLPGRITSGIGMRTHPVGGFRGKHTGVDLAAQEGTRIAAAASGTVIQTGEGEYIGAFVILSHKDSYTTLYGHCSQILTTKGKTVKKGQIIAKVGSTGRVTGPHLHFEIRKNGVPQDPLKYLW
jgi:murein DD-endopeptidase MepM/ murein hydrolase activator NlpD